MQILCVAANIILNYIITEVITITTGHQRKCGKLLTFIILLVPALSLPLMNVKTLSAFFITRLLLVILSIFGKFIAYSIIFGKFRLNIMYVCLLSLITSQTYSTIFAQFIKNDSLLSIVAFIFEAALLLAFVILIRRRNSAPAVRQELSSIPKLQYAGILLLAYLINIFIWASLDSRHQTMARILMIPTMLGLIAVLISIMTTTISAHKQRTISALLSEQMDNQVEYYRKINLLYSDFRAFRHDFKNHLLCLRSLISENENEKAMEYINDIEELSIKHKNKFDTGNIIIDSLLTDKDEKAQETGAKIVFNGYAPTMGIKNSDCAVVFSNALDNAIEACSKDTEGREKVITIDSDFRQGYFFVRISNPMFSAVSFKGKNQLVTSKTDKSLHGFGVANIINTVQKYDGNVDISTDNDVFCLDITIHLRNELKNAEQ